MVKAKAEAEATPGLDASDAVAVKAAVVGKLTPLLMKILTAELQEQGFTGPMGACAKPSKSARRRTF